MEKQQEKAEYAGPGVGPEVAHNALAAAVQMYGEALRAKHQQASLAQMMVENMGRQLAEAQKEIRKLQDLLAAQRAEIQSRAGEVETRVSTETPRAG